jgi:hypothetical protein
MWHRRHWRISTYFWAPKIVGDRESIAHWSYELGLITSMYSVAGSRVAG